MSEELLRSPEAFLWNRGQAETLGGTQNLLRRFTSVGVSDLPAATAGPERYPAWGCCVRQCMEISSSPFLLNCHSLLTVALVDRKSSFSLIDNCLISSAYGYRELIHVWVFVMGFHLALVHLHLKFVKRSVHE